MKLYELTARYKAMMDEMEHEEFPQEAFADTLDSIWDCLTEKAENIVKMILNMDAEIEGLKREENPLASRRRTLENRKEKLKEYLLNQMEVAKIDKIRTPLCTISVQSNPQKIEIVDETIIPEECWIVEKTLDRRRVADQLRDGNEIPGV